MLWAIYLAGIGVLPLLIFHILFKIKYRRGYPPGPMGIPLLGYIPWLGSEPHVNIGKLGQKYGNIFSIQIGNMSMVVLNNLEAVKGALKLDTCAGRPNHILAMSVAKLGVVFSTGKVWREQRRFSLKALRDVGFGRKSMEVGIQEEIEHLVRFLRSHLNQPIDFKEAFSISVVNTLWAMLTGNKLSTELDDSKSHQLLKLGKEGLTDPNISGAVFVLPWLAKILPGKGGFARVQECVNILGIMMREIIAEHQRTFVPGSPRDYIDLYLQQMALTTESDSSFFKESGIDNLVDSLIGLFTAGSDTMTALMDYTFLFMLTYPDIRRKVQKEIDHVVGRSRRPNITDRSKLPYVEAVMQESMRMGVIAPGAILHDTTEDVEFMGFNLPKGTILLPNIYQIHYNEDYWKDPNTFRPERFINEDGSFRKDENVMSFSVGRRVCLAENIAAMEYFLYFTNILQEFDIEPNPDCPLPGFEAAKPAHVISPNPYKIIFKQRQ